MPSLPAPTSITEIRRRVNSRLWTADEEWCVASIGYLLAEVERLQGLINHPEIDDFIEGTRIEAAHQENRWGADDRAGKEPQDWYWLVGYLSGKALRAAIDGDVDKHRHHCISTAAVLANWHKSALGKSRMRPGHAPAADLVGS